MASAADASTPPSAELVLRLAKDNVAMLHQLVAQAERGAVIDFARARAMIAETTQRLQQSLLLCSSGNSGTSSDGGALGGGSVHARVGACARLVSTTELQRRRAQHVLTELEYMDAVLQRHAHTAQQRQQRATQLHELRSSNGGSNSTERVEFAALDAYEREQRSLQYTRRRMQQMQSESSEVLRALQDQGARLGGVAGKLTRMFEAIDVSNLTMAQILRRNKVDAWLVYCGIAALLFLLWWMLW